MLKLNAVPCKPHPVATLALGKAPTATPPMPLTFHFAYKSNIHRTCHNTSLFICHLQCLLQSSKLLPEQMTQQKILTQTCSIETPYHCLKDVIQSFYCILILEVATIAQKGQWWPIRFVKDLLGQKCKHTIGHFFITQNVERGDTS